MNGQSAELADFVSANGELQLLDRALKATFVGGLGSYQIRIKFPRPVHSADGVGAVFTLRGWKDIQYVAVGYTDSELFRHIKVKNPLDGVATEIMCGFSDLVFRIQNGWSNVFSADVADLRIYVKGEPDGEGEILVDWVSAWDVDSKPEPSYASSLDPDAAAVTSLICDHLAQKNPDYRRRAAEFVETGDFPVIGRTRLPWKSADLQPEDVGSNGTYRYIWHSLCPAGDLLVYGLIDGVDAAIYAARDMINSWLDHNFYCETADTKYAWYDHGAAERLMVFLLMAQVGGQRGFDGRFMLRLNQAIEEHANLLLSEAFYAFNQPTRHHNHAWFQDIALLMAGIIGRDSPSSDYRISTGLARLRDQFDSLITRDSGFAVFVENSTGYQEVIQHLVGLTEKLAAISGRETKSGELVRELRNWSDVLRYPDGRAPSLGDTFRTVNGPAAEAAHAAKLEAPGLTVLPIAGYAVAKGLHQGLPQNVMVYASNLSATHKHADHLSFTLFFDGVEWLIDPGFFSYEPGDAVAQYLRGPWAHNATVIDDVPYSLAPGRATLGGFREGSEYVISGMHEAFRGHQVSRQLSGRLDRLQLRGHDEVLVAECADDHEGNDFTATSVFHLGEGVVVQPSGHASWLLTHGRSRYGLVIGAMVSGAVVRGVGSSPKTTSVSAGAYGEFQPTSSLMLEHPVGQPLEWTLDAVDRNPST